MNRIQYFIALFIFVAFTACQSDTAMNTAKDTMQKSKDMTQKVVEKAKNEVKEAVEQAPKQTKLREFYVEEDKSKMEPKSAASEKAPKKETTKKKVVKAKAKSKKSPKMAFVNDTHAFGIIKPGDVIEHKFEFTNTGSADLVITDAKATCGCTQPSFPFVPIPPGEKGYIGVKYDSTGKLGSQKPTVTITTNGSPKTQKVYLEGLVISQLSKN